MNNISNINELEWISWDKSNPPKDGRYLVHDPAFRSHDVQIWSYFGNYWHNAGNWIADRPPAYYMELPKFKKG